MHLLGRLALVWQLKTLQNTQSSTFRLIKHIFQVSFHLTAAEISNFCFSSYSGKLPVDLLLSGPELTKTLRY